MSCRLIRSLASSLGRPVINTVAVTDDIIALEEQYVLNDEN
jgi:hypothetical protein